MALHSDYQKLEPGNNIRLIEVDGTAFGMEDILRFHAYNLPYTAEEIADAANIVLRRADFDSVAVANGVLTLTTSGFTIDANGQAGTIFGINGGGFAGNIYRSVSVDYRLLTEPENDGYLVNYVSDVHDHSGNYQKTGHRTQDSTVLEDGWFRLTIDMSQLTNGGDDWLKSQIQRVRIALWNGGNTGQAEIRAVRYINHDPADIDPSALPAKCIWWQGNEYQAWPYQVEGIEASTSGSSAQPEMTVSNLDSSITALCLAYDDLLKAKVTVHDTLAQYLDAKNFADGNPLADPTQEKLKAFYIDAKSGELPGESVSFTLSSPFELQGLQIPTRQLHSLCTWCMRGKYRSGDGCDYAGTAYFDKNNNPVDDPSLDVCSGTLTACKCRHGENNELPFGGFPGTSLIRS